jgi:hypothetical protein
MSFGITVAGGCNGSSSTNQTILNDPADVMVGYNNTLYVCGDSQRLFVFELNNRTGSVIRSFSNWPSFLFLDNRTADIYVTVSDANIVYILSTNKTIPPNGLSSASCSMNWLYSASGIVVDSVGNVYISSYQCHWVTKWAPNASSATVVAGSSAGSAGSTSSLLNGPYNLALDEANSFLYVVDRYNHRVQRFVLGGSGIGVTVAGGHGQGTAANQLNSPTDIYLSRLDGSIYIADSYNNRVQKWSLNATSGITVAGSPNGTAGRTSYLMQLTYSLAVDYDENYLYVSDSDNSRIQRFSLH